MKCSACDNPYHPSTGHRWSDDLRLCGPCAKDWWDWLKRRMRSMRSVRKGMKTSFDQAALTSNIPDRSSDGQAV